jgi:hypothetical protein
LEHFKDKLVFVSPCCTPFIVWDVTTIQIMLQTTSSIHISLPEAFATHPKPILSIPGKILSTPATCDPFFYFNNPNHCAIFCDVHSQSKSGKLHVCGSLPFICHHIDAYFSVPQTSKPTTQITHDGKR